MPIVDKENNSSNNQNQKSKIFFLAITFTFALKHSLS